MTAPVRYADLRAMLEQQRLWRWQPEPLVDAPRPERPKKFTAARIREKGRLTHDHPAKTTDD